RFDGNNYAREWREEATRRALPQSKNAVEALHTWREPAVQELLTQSQVMSASEQEARIHVRLEQYVKALHIESQLLREMAETVILPAVLEDLHGRAATLGKLRELGAVDGGQPSTLGALLKHQTQLCEQAYERLAQLKAAVAAAEEHADLHK